MNCEEVKQHFEAAFDGATRPELETTVFEHIRVCSACRAAWDEMQSLRSVLRANATHAPSASLDARVMRAFARAHERREAVAPWWKRFVSGSIRIPKPAFATLLAAIALALIAALQIGRLTATQVSLEPPAGNAGAAAPLPPARIVYVPVEIERDVLVAKPAPTTTTACGLQASLHGTKDTQGRECAGSDRGAPAGKYYGGHGYGHKLRYKSHARRL